MKQLIEDLLAYSRTNTLERKYESAGLQMIIEEVKEDLKEELKQKHAVIETGELNHFHMIAFQFRQLLFNLVSNSLKFARPDKAPVIRISSQIAKSSQLGNNKLAPSENYCHITVADNGIGFEPEYNHKIFEVFQRLHSSEQYQGTGIGLAIVKKIVDNHNGVITATGELGKGAKFDIYIPLSIAKM